MLKRTKRVGIIIGIVFGLFLIMIGISFMNHRIQLSKEGSLFIPTGKMVEVNGHKIHIYTEGQGNETLVFMSGGGTSSPVLDFKSLYSLLSNQYKIAVVEKAGYGFSEIASTSRDIDIILEETREGLSKAGLQPPYILFPHSMSGIEALYWAQQYPYEVKGIVGLDMAVPEAYEDYRINHSILKLARWGSTIGITRFFPSVVEDSAAIKYGLLTKEEKDLYRAVFYRRTLTKPMYREIDAIKSSAEKVKGNGIPTVPMLFFISNGEGTGWNPKEWIEFQISYIQNTGENRYIELNCGHYVHDIKQEIIAEESQRFIEDI
ncbi:MAG TPA: alpha/beta hydrolase [Epulopiscium sp.]|nr:alpha/beta hydrolase [Candidatus Epulonipiscium sp.]